MSSIDDFPNYAYLTVGELWDYYPECRAALAKILAGYNDYIIRKLREESETEAPSAS